MSKKIKLIIEGMHCSSCSNKLETAFVQNLENLEHISINVPSGYAELELKNDDFSEKSLRRIIDKAGFSLQEII
ncbi:MAG: heavy-metal-associated domain-containing protein [Cyanobacteriota bacterium]